MKQTLTSAQAVEILLRDFYANWSCDAARAIVEHLEQLELEQEIEIELDAPVIRCDFSEFKSFDDFKKVYSEFNSKGEIKNHFGFVEFLDNGHILVEVR